MESDSFSSITPGISVNPVYGLTHHHSPGERRRNSAKPFCGVDGEGGNVPQHEYLLLRAGEHVLETGKPLTAFECFAFLAELPKDRIYVGYFFDYDVNMMVRQLPMERFERLYDREKRNGRGGQLLPVDVGPFQIDYLPHKEFKVRYAGEKQWTVISDVGTFFQTSFLKTLETWKIGTEEDWRMIEAGKTGRAEFGPVTRNTRKYNELEIRLLEQLMEEYRKVCTDIGYIPKKYQGPGNLASAMLQAHKVVRRDQIDILGNMEFKTLANEAYYGGRFETTIAGPVNGKVWQYDINSAYPAVIKTLPCLIHGSWKKVRMQPEGGTYFALVRYKHPTESMLYNLPFRDQHGNISYPRNGIGVYWGVELEAAQRGGTQLYFDHGWLYEKHCDCDTFRFVKPVYAKRIEYGSDSRGRVLKLGLNSLYGKMAQSIGYAPFANPVWAGLITAGCRAQIIDAYSQAPDMCYMIATDGIFSGVPLDLPVSGKTDGKQLGLWDLTEHESMFIVQPGIYFTDDDVKTRGVEKSLIRRMNNGKIWSMRPQFEELWELFVSTGGTEGRALDIEVTNFITCSQALARSRHPDPVTGQMIYTSNHWDVAGTWDKTTKSVGFDWRNKRKMAVCLNRPEGCRTLPLDGLASERSVPYTRIIGGTMKLAQHDRYGRALTDLDNDASQPDHAETLFGRDKETS